jgi:hypothetical protein
VVVFQSLKCEFRFQHAGVRDLIDDRVYVKISNAQKLELNGEESASYRIDYNAFVGQADSCGQVWHLSKALKSCRPDNAHVYLSSAEGATLISQEEAPFFTSSSPLRGQALLQ